MGQGITLQRFWALSGKPNLNPCPLTSPALSCSMLPNEPVAEGQAPPKRATRAEQPSHATARAKLLQAKISEACVLRQLEIHEPSRVWVTT